jgi:hypothetical protein
MKVNIIGATVAMALVFSTSGAFAQTGQNTQPNQATTYNPALKPPPAVYGNDSGYSGGGAAAQKAPGGQYNQGSAQSLVPSPAQAEAEQTGNGGMTGQKSSN